MSLTNRVVSIKEVFFIPLFSYLENGKSPPTIKSISSVSLPDKNEYFQVFVSAIESPNHIWVQLVNQDSVKLTELDRELIETYGKLKENEERLESGE